MVIPTRVGKHRQVCRIAGPSGGPNRWQTRYRESQGADLTGPARDSFLRCGTTNDRRRAIMIVGAAELAATVLEEETWPRGS
jgi:hypothetical protein